MIDIGVNLTNKRFDKDRDELINRAKNIGVEKILITGTSVRESELALKLCESFRQKHPDTLYATAGVHPHDADRVSEDYLEVLAQLAVNSNVKAIGECGLDFNRNFSKPSQQIKIFKEQIRLAKRLAMPLFLHQRDAFDVWYSELKPFIGDIPSMVTHCFTGNKDELKICLDAGMYIGITGWICDERRGKTLQEIVSLIPLEQLLVETDAPYLIPRTIKPKPKSSRNEPSYLPFIIDKIANITGLDPNEIACQTRINAQKVFNLPK